MKKVTAMMISPAYTLAYAIISFCQLMYQPMPYLAPSISAVTSVMNDEQVPLNRPRNICGIAAGMPTLAMR